jgi:hypothetical protein
MPDKVFFDTNADAMFEMVKEYHGKRNLKALDLTHAMIDKFGEDDQWNGRKSSRRFRRGTRMRRSATHGKCEGTCIVDTRDTHFPGRCVVSKLR